MENITNPIPEVLVILEKPKTNYLNLILISVAFVFFLAGAYYLGQQSTKVVEVPTVVPTTAPVAVIPTVNPATNWKTYTDSKYGFSINYPSNFKFESKEGIVNISDLRVAEPNCKRGGCYLGDYSLKLSLISIAINQTNLKSIVGEKYKQEQNSAIDVTPLKLTKLNNYPAYYYEATGAERYSNYYVMSDSGAVLKLSFVNNDSQYLNQILSTFKFTESKAVDINSIIKSSLIAQNPSLKLIDNQIKIGETQVSGDYLSVAVNFSGGGYVIHMTKIDNIWKIVASGQEPPTCSVLEKYNFPKEFGCNP